MRRVLLVAFCALLASCYALAAPGDRPACLATTPAALVSCVDHGSGRAASTGWRVDRSLGFHVAFLDETRPEGGKALEPVEFAGAGLADITNINLPGFLSLGFPVPGREKPDLYRVYLKFYRYPRWLDAAITTGRLERALLLGETAGAAKLQALFAEPGAVVVKAAYIGLATEAEKPFPPLSLPDKLVETAHGLATPQGYLDAHLPFSSVYLQPGDDRCPGHDDKSKATASAQGVLAFHRELLAAYARLMPCVKAPGAESAHTFVQGPAEAKAGASVVVFKVPREPMVFPNVRDLPMPQDPKHIFLSGLLLVYRNEYRLREAVDGNLPLPGTPEFARLLEPVNAHVFEVGSVVTLP